MTKIDWLSFWYQALASPLGVSLAVSDIDHAKQALYRARAAANDPQLSKLQLRVSPVLPKEELWIVKTFPKEDSPNGPKV